MSKSNVPAQKSYASDEHIMSETDKLARLLREMLYVLAIMVIFSWVEGWFGPFTWLHKLDSTDAPDQRSGMRLYTDHLTGCQYLGTKSGLTPRRDAAGKIICKIAGNS